MLKKWEEHSRTSTRMNEKKMHVCGKHKTDTTQTSLDLKLLIEICDRHIYWTDTRSIQTCLIWWSANQRIRHRILAILEYFITSAITCRNMFCQFEKRLWATKVACYTNFNSTLHTYIQLFFELDTWMHTLNSIEFVEDEKFTIKSLS